VVLGADGLVDDPEPFLAPHKVRIGGLIPHEAPPSSVYNTGHANHLSLRLSRFQLFHRAATRELVARTRGARRRTTAPYRHQESRPGSMWSRHTPALWWRPITARR